MQLKQLTGSYVAVGLIGIAEFVPILVCGLWGGAIADVRDRRRFVLVTEALQLLMSAVLVGNALLANPQVWLIYLVAAGAAAAASIQRPSFEAITPRIVPPEHQSAASALTGLQYTGAEVLAPALGGALAATSLSAAYVVDVATFVVSLGLFARIAAVPPSATGRRVDFARVWEGVRYAGGRRDLLGTYVVDMVGMSLAMPVALFPFLADQLHHPRELGLLYSAGAVGGVLATLTSGWTSRVHRQGVAIVLASVGFGAGMAVAGIAPSFWLVLLCLALANASDVVSGIFRSTVWNTTIPDQLRGRLAGIGMLSYTTGPSLGNARAGLMARLGGVRFAIGAGGACCVAGVALTAALLPAFLRYDARTDEHAATERARRAAITA